MSQIGEARFRAAYAAHRQAEGRGTDERTLLALPHVRTGPLAREWAVRARSFAAFVQTVWTPRARAAAPRRLRLLDLGAGNGWLCHRMTRAGAAATALDWRHDAVDGLGAAAAFARHLEPMFPRVAASFTAIPVAPATFDLVVFNASLHYTVDLAAALGEGARVLRPDGCLVIIDSPFYSREADGERMIAEKRRTAARAFGPLAPDLLALPAIEFLTRDRLAAASRPLGLAWRRHRVRYPLWYELRPLRARWRGERVPSRFDVWEGTR